MSVISLLVFPPERLPSLESLKAKAREDGDLVEFTDDIDLASHTGYWPMRVFGRDTGFEYYFEPVPPNALPDEAMQFGSHHIVTRTGSDFEEGRAALAFLRIAACLTGGAYVYPDDEIIVPPADVEAYLNEQITVYGKYID